MPNVFEYSARVSRTKNLVWSFKGAHDHIDFKQTKALLDQRRAEDPDLLGFLVQADTKKRARARITEINRTPKNLDGFYIL